MAYEIYTIGHSNRAFEDFVKLLKQYKVELLVDIRRYPSSRFKWFCRDYLEVNLPRYDINYKVFSALGALGIARFIKPLEDISCIDSPTYRAYITYLLINEGARRYINKIVGFVKEGITCCLMCCERFPWRCHRYYLSDFLLVLGINVFHIIDEKRLMQHKGSRCFDYIKANVSELWRN